MVRPNCKAEDLGLAEQGRGSFCSAAVLRPPQLLSISFGSAQFGTKYPANSQSYLRMHKPVVSVAFGQLAPSDVPAEQTTETKVSPSSQLTVLSPITTRNTRLDAP
jgi:hypothetical protein